MATIWWEQRVEAPAIEAWAALRDVGQAHRLFAPVLIDGSLAGDVRSVRFANGIAVDEKIIAIDEPHRRVAYAVLGDMFEHHSASMQIVPIDATSCVFVWISDFLPDASAGLVQPLVEQGSRALARNIENSLLTGGVATADGEGAGT